MEDDMPSGNHVVSPPAPTFEGRLALQDFAFQQASTGSLATGELRRSSRTSVLATSLPSPAPTPRRAASARSSRSATPSKRKAVAPSAPSDAAASSPPAPKKPRRRGTPGGYAPPSAYSHLPQTLPDAVGPGMLVLFVGLNPGVETARQGHAYTHPSNLFWKLLASSGVTPRLVPWAEDRSLPAAHALGLTNIVGRPSRCGSELSRAEMDAGVAALERKARAWRPEAVAFVGKSIWESVWRVRHGRSIRKEEFRYGWQDEGESFGVIGEEGMREDEKVEGVDYGNGGAWKGARVFVATSTSGLAASLRPAEKEAIWRQLGEWVERRREERNTA